MHYCIKVEAAVSIAQSDFLRMQETKKRFYIVTFSGHDWTRNVSSFFPTFESEASFYSPSFEVECWASCSSASLNVCDEKKKLFLCVWCQFLRFKYTALCMNVSGYTTLMFFFCSFIALKYSFLSLQFLFMRIGVVWRRSRYARHQKISEVFGVFYIQALCNDNFCICLYLIYIFK